MIAKHEDLFDEFEEDDFGDEDFDTIVRVKAAAAPLLPTNRPAASRINSNVENNRLRSPIRSGVVAA